MRIHKEKVEIDKEKVKKFFEGRQSRIASEPLTAVLYQDNNPDLAHARDIYERDKILPLLKLKKESLVLDIGCGIGRWASVVSPKVKEYFGIDFAEEFIDFAKKQYSDLSNVSFKHLDAMEISTANLNNLNFDRVIIAGLLLYLNDKEVQQFSLKLKEVLKPNHLIYLREPIAVNERLSLSNIWSEELKQNYSAIYRTREELLELLGDVNIEFEDDMYEAHLNNRPETKQHFFIFKY
jgi:cyclopropane fatty-acyl-phospholipid synthase-like methyltransferase